MGIVYDWTLEGADPLIARLETAPEVLRAEMEQAMQEMVLLTRYEVEERTPVDTGRLMYSEKGEVTDGGMIGRIWTDRDYAPYVERGRGPVYAKPGGWLRFKPKGSSKFIYRKSVGPAPAFWMFRDGLEASHRAIADRFGRVCRSLARYIAGK